MFRSSRYRKVKARVQGSDTPRIAATSYMLLGLILGLTGGLAYAWLINPVIYIDATPARLNDRYTSEYIFLVSQSYAATGDWEQAQARLMALEERNLPQRVADLFEQHLRQGSPAAYVRNLAVLTQKLGGKNPALSLFAPTPQPPPITATPTEPGPTATATLLPTPTPSRAPTRTPQPSLTPSVTPQASPTALPTYRLLSQERICDANVPVPRIEVVTVDALLDPLPGVEVIVSWEGGSDHFFTGFQPDRDPGYGDFTMNPDTSYTVVLKDGSPTISGLRIEPCEENQGGLAGGWRLTFQNLTLNEPTPTPTPQP